MIIAIDGVAGAGKSTVANLVAEKTGFFCLNSGAIFRAITLAFLSKENCDVSEKNLKKVLKENDVTVRFENGLQQTFLNGSQVDDLIRTPSVSALTSKVAQLKVVRKKVLKLQHEVAKTNNLVIEGRDIGTEVFPKATLKIFLTADATERAKRRLAELKNNGENYSLEDITKQMLERDKADMTRKISPLKCAKDAIIVDSTHISANQVAEKILNYLKEKQK